MERYRVRRFDVVVRLEQAVEASGGRVLKRPDPTSAPFEMTVVTPLGQTLELVCYAFTANKYEQGGRPSDEHRFQVKYGSAFDRYHDLFLDPKRKRITLFLGVHIELDLFVGVDPRMHNPTWFSRSLEVKQQSLDEVRASGWHGWERERSAARRKREMPIEDLRTETVIGFVPKHFLRYAQLEGVASGLDPGERLLLSDRIERQITSGIVPSRGTGGHLLEEQLGLSAHEILDVIGDRFRLMAAVRGGVAEHHLGLHLKGLPGVTAVRRIDEDSKPDFEIEYRRHPFLIECKNVLRRGDPTEPRVDFQKTRASQGDPCSRYYKASQFDVLAACLHPVTEKWEFRFSLTSTLALHRRCQNRLSDRVIVAGDTWQDRLPRLLDSVGR